MTIPLPPENDESWTDWAADIHAKTNAALPASSAYTDEQARDAIAAALVAGANITITPNDGANTITIATTGGGTSTVKTPEQYGAVGNGTTNDNTAMQALVADLDPGDTVFLAHDKTYTYTAYLDVLTDNVTITGGGTLKPTNFAGTALFLEADGITVDGLRMTFDTTGVSRQNASVNTMLSPWNSEGIVVRNVTIDGSPSVGIFTHGCTNFLIENVRVSNTLADGVHTTGGSSFGRIENCTTKHTGDDGFAVVSYEAAGGPNVGMNHDIEIVNAHVIDSYVARGVSVVGGQNIVYRGVVIEGSSSSGIYIACEGSFSTYGCSNIVVDGAVVKNANSLNTGRPNHGAIYLASTRSGFTITDVIIRNVSARDTAADISQQVGVINANSGTTSNVLLERLVGYGTGPTTMLAGNATGAVTQSYVKFSPGATG